MKKENKRKINNQSGAAMLILVVFFLFISLATISGLVSPSIREFKNSNVNLNSKKSFFLSESGSEDAFYRIIKNKPIGSSETITLDSNTATTAITSVGTDKMQITSLGDVSSYQRQTGITLSTSVGASFSYGVQVGQGGINLTGSGTVNGNVYSNGPITGDGSAVITGTAISAGSGGLIQGSGGVWNPLHIGTVSGMAKAHTINYTNATLAIYCQTGTGNNKSCISQADSSYAAFPVSDANIAQWKADATAGGINNGDLVVGNWPTQYVTLGPKKIVGNLNVTGGGILTVSGTLWVTGNIVVSGGSTIQLASSYGSDDGVIIADGTIVMSGGGHATGSGAAGSYLMVVTTNSGSNAVTLSGGSGAVIVYAPFGTMNISGGASLKEATAYQLNISGGSSITYESGLINSNFSSGPSGSWSVKSWGEK